VDLLVNNGWDVRALDNLEPQTHRRGKPSWINKKAEFVQGDLRDRDTIAAALDKIDIVFTRLPTAVTCQRSQNLCM